MIANTDRTTEKPIELRRRDDLVVVPQRFGSDNYWVVKDPVSLRFVRLREAEFALFDAIDGRRSLQDLGRLFETRFAPARIRSEEISRFVGMLQQCGLLISERPGQGPMLHKRGKERLGRERRGRWLNPLAMRFRGFDPTRLFAILLPWVRPLFTRTALVLSLLFVASAALLVAVRWDEFMARMPTLHQFFTPSNILLLSAVLAIVKVLHEFGHGLTCRYFGGESHELGAMVLVFTPCLYCDVTDSWRFPNKWHRAAVGAAGIFVELNLAAAATFLWWFSEPGLLHQISLGVMTVSSLGTIVFNGNPLMRYDGYYILADIVEQPNLAERSAAVLRHYFSQYCLGIEEEENDPLLPTEHRKWLAAYAAASGLYRWIVTFSIILFLVAAARPYRLEYLARLVGLMGVSALFVGPLLRLKKLLVVPGVRQRMKASRIFISSAAALTLAAFLAFVPLPHRIFGPLEMQPYDPSPIYAEVAGRLVEVGTRYGDVLASGSVVARLENRDVDLAVEELSARRDRQRAELTGLRREKFENATAALSIPRAEKLLASLEDQLREKLRDQARLTLSAAAGGTLFPPVYSPEVEEDENLANWTGRPLDSINLGCTVEVGTLLGQIGDPHVWQAAVVLDQEDVEFVSSGDEVEIILDSLPNRTFRGTVEEIAIGELRDAPQRLSNKAGGELPTTDGSASAERPISTSYLVRVRIDAPDVDFRVGWRGIARVEVQPISLGARLLRRLSRTFHFHL